MTSTVTVVAAQVKIAGRILLQLDEHAPVKVPADGRIRIEYRFNYIEVSRKRDDFHLGLTSKLGGRSADPASYSHTDRMGVADDHDGALRQEYAAPKKGKHELTFTATAEYLEGGEAHTDSVQGIIPIHVV